MSITATRATSGGITSGGNTAQGVIFYPHIVLSLPYASTITIPDLECEEHTFVVGELTGAVTVNAPLPKFMGDKLFLLFSADSSNRVITFGTNFKSAGTLTCTAAKFASAQFQFDGNNWVEIGRTITT